MNTFKSRLGVALVALVLAAPAGIAATRSTSQSLNRSDVGASELNKKIRKQLVTLPYYGVFDNLAFSVDGGTVTLYGQVVRPTTRSDAERRVARLSGVNRVVNKIQVLPLSSFDDSIRRRAYRAIARTGGLYRYMLGVNPSIHIVVDRGHVTLEGVVSNQGDATLAYMAANGVPGAFSVTNNLRVERDKAY